MAKKSSTLPLNLKGPKARVPLYRWLYEELRSAILAGRLHPGARLPATRDLASQYGISRPTIVTAFEQLRSEGYVEGKVGSGTYVSKTLPDELLQAPRYEISGRARGGAAFRFLPMRGGYSRCFVGSLVWRGHFAQASRRSMLFP